MAVHDKLKAVRRFLSLSQKEIEMILDLSQRDISQLENGKKKFIPIEYIQFLNKKQIPLELLFDDEINLYDFETSLSKTFLEGKKNTPLDTPHRVGNERKEAESDILSPIINQLLFKIDEKDALITEQAKNIGALQKEVEMLQKGFGGMDTGFTALDDAKVAKHASVRR